MGILFLSGKVQSKEVLRLFPIFSKTGSYDKIFPDLSTQ